MPIVRTIEPAELYDLYAESGGLTLIDVREPGEYAAARTPFGANHPLSALSRGELGKLRDLARDEPVFVICRSGQRSLKACALLAGFGFVNTVNVAGGLLACQSAGLPVLDLVCS